MDDYKILPLGDRGISVEFGNEISVEMSRRVWNFCRCFQKEKQRGVLDVVPTYRSAMITFDRRKVNYKRLIRKIHACAGRGEVCGESRKIYEIPVCYEEEFGVDLEQVALCSGLSKEEVVRHHCKNDYLIYMLGFLPGFPYLGGMDSAIAVPRLREPRVLISRGSAGIAGMQTGIYPVDSPGGWQLVGRTPVRIYDAARKKPVLFEAGEYIRFVRIDRKEYGQIQDLEEQHRYVCNVKED